jgi:HK97 family phage prohead protease
MSTNKKEYEIRNFTLKETRSELIESEGKRFIQGKIPYDSLSGDLGGFKEILIRGAFNKTLNDGFDVKALVNHSDGKVLGRVKNGTLKLEDRADGLICTVELGNQSYSNDLWESIKRDDVSTMSFGFRTIADEWKNENGKQFRMLKEAHLLEVSFGVSFPAYEETSSFTMYRSLYKESGLNFDVINTALIKMKDKEELSDEERSALKAISDLVKEPEVVVEKVEEPQKRTLGILEQELALLERSI